MQRQTRMYGVLALALHGDGNNQPIGVSGNKTKEMLLMYSVLRTRRMEFRSLHGMAWAAKLLLLVV